MAADYDVRRATLDDVDQMVDMTIKLCAAAKCERWFDVDPDTVRELAMATISDETNGCPLVAEEDDGRVVGCLLGLASPNPLARSNTIASELVLWVEPEHRQHGVGKKLVASFLKWTGHNGHHNASIGYSHGLSEESIANIANALGLEPIETVYMKRV